jgi:hypothetical protein
MLDDPELLREIVRVHAAAVAALATQHGASYGPQLFHALLDSGDDSSASLEPIAGPPPPCVADIAAAAANESHKMGLRILEAKGGCAPYWVNAAATGGVMRGVAGALRAIDASQLAAAAAAPARGVDMQRPCLVEAQLLVPPVAAFRSRLQEMLAAFPEQALLLQMLEICQRLLSAPRLTAASSALEGPCTRARCTHSRARRGLG